MHAGFGVFQIEIKVFCESFDGCFAGVVGCVAWRICDALFASCDDDRAWFAGCARFKRRCISVQPIDHAIEIGVKNLGADGLEAA